MASEKDAKIENARKFAEAGQFVKAIKAWRELLDDSPNDANVYNTIGDLCLKNKDNSEAIEAYSKAARFYLQEGFHLKAVALYKKILKLDPNRAEIYTLLGDLNVVRGLMSNAVADYLSGAKLYLKIGKAMNALTLFRKITKVDPQNTDMRLRVAELCLKEKLTDEAIDEYLRIGREYQRLGRAEEAKKLYGQILKISPGHAEARRRLDTPYVPEEETPEMLAPAVEEMTVSDTVQAAVALETPAAPEPVPEAAGPPATLEEARRVFATGDVGEAERMVRNLLTEDPDRSEYQALLGMIYLKKGHGSVAYDILYPIAKSWEGGERRADAMEIIEAFLAAEPGNAGFQALKVPPAPAPPLEPAPAPEPVPTEASIEMPVDLAPALEGSATPPTAVQAEGLGAAPAGLEPDVEAVFEAFRKGVKEQVGEEDYETHYDLGVAYKEMGLIAEAIEELQLAANGPTRFVDACTMIAACYRDQGLNKPAITLLERALEDARCAGPGAPYVKYDLAVLYEEEGFADKAVRLYEDIPSIRDVESRLRRLQGGEEPPVRTPPGTKRPISYL